MLVAASSASVTKDDCKRKGLVISSCFLRKLLLYIATGFYSLLFNPICGLLCLLSHWESVNNHSYRLNRRR